MSAVYEQSPYGQLWRDPAMKPFHDKFITKWKEEFSAPLERDLGAELDDFSSLLQGEFALAVTQDGWQAKGGGNPGLLLLLDTRDKSDQLKTLLADLRKKWVDAGKTVRTEKIHDTEFFVVTLSSNAVPKTLAEFFPRHQEIQELGKEPEKKTADNGQLIVGQVQSLLIAGSSLKAVTKVVLRLAGDSVPTLADDATFEANRLAFFRDAPVYAWFNAKSVFDVLAHLPPEKPNPQAPNPFALPSMDKVVKGCGLTGLKSVAFALHTSNEGTLFDLYLDAPEASRQGLLKLLAPETKDSNPPAFIPANAVKFWRWRLDGPKAVTTLEKMIAEVSPSTLNSWNFLISNGEEGVKVVEPNYDLRRDLFGNLGDDFISYEKAPRGTTPADLDSPPSLLLVSSPNAEQLLRGLRGALILRSGDALNPKTREFLGRKIYSISLPPTSRTLSYAASGGYVAFSTDASMVEEYLRSGEGQGKSFRDTPGLAEAAQKVGGQNCGLFGCENRVETMRSTFAAFKKLTGVSTNRPVSTNRLTASLPYARPEKNFEEWMDFSLLPDYDKIAKYFYYTVYSGSANVDGITFRFFSPTPPALRH